MAHRRVSYSFARSRDNAREMRVGMLVSDNFFSALGVTPAAGRLFADAEARPGQDAVSSSAVFVHAFQEGSDSFESRFAFGGGEFLRREA